MAAKAQQLTAFQNSNRMAAKQLHLLREVLDAGGTAQVKLEMKPMSSARRVVGARIDKKR